MFELQHSVRAAFPERKVEVTRETGSTNDDAKAAARAGAPSGSLFVADRQTQGRGRGGRSWQAEPGDALLFSLVLRPAVSPARLPELALVAGLAVAEAIERHVTGAVKVKWPNDVWIDGRKVAGILVEGVTQGASVVAAIAGIGVNVGTRAFPPELTEIATSLRLAGAEVDRAELLAEIVAALEARAVSWERSGLPADELAARDALLGRAVRVRDVAGTAAGIDASGALLVRVAGDVVRVVADEVELQR